MRFFYSKKEHICHACKTTISYNDEAVCIRWKSNGTFIPLVFHVGCYANWMVTSFNNRWVVWKEGTTPRPIRHKRGRKFLYKTREQATLIHQLQALKSYHQSQGHLEEVKIIEEKITHAREENSIPANPRSPQGIIPGDIVQSPGV
jgi:hypothetical protein